MKRIEHLLNQSLPSVAPAIAVSVSHHGEKLWSWTGGCIDPDTGQGQITSTTLFDLASVSKLFTTTALLSVIDNLNLDTPLVEIIPEFGEIAPRSIIGGQDPHTLEDLPVASNLVGHHVDPSGVTLRHLLTHTSGLPAWRMVFNTSPPPPPPNEPDPITKAQRWERACKQLCRYGFSNHIGAKIIYSDIGLMLLGEVIARLNQTDLETAIQQHVLEPLKLQNTLYNPVRDGGRTFEEIVPTEYDHRWRGRRIWGAVHDENCDGLGGVTGHAGLFSTLDDVTTFGEAWLQRSTFNIPSHLWDEATQEQVSMDDERRGLGWMLPSIQKSSAGDIMSRSSFGHTGFTGTSIWIDPQNQVVIVALTNRVYHGRDNMSILSFRRTLHDAIMREVLS
jgi:CubicO group peptidase (beta-lactamase class C family)